MTNRLSPAFSKHLRPTAKPSADQAAETEAGRRGRQARDVPAHAGEIVRGRTALPQDSLAQSRQCQGALRRGKDRLGGRGLQPGGTALRAGRQGISARAAVPGRLGRGERHRPRSGDQALSKGAFDSAEHDRSNVRPRACICQNRPRRSSVGSFREGAPPRPRAPDGKDRSGRRAHQPRSNGRSVSGAS